MRNLFFILFFASAISIFGQKNLISNGSFEDDSQSWNNESVLTISSYTKKTGEKAGSITEYTTPQWKGIDQHFSIPKNSAAIEVSAWLKADGIEKGKNTWNKAVMVIEINGKNENIAELDGTTNWQLVKKIIPINKNRSGRLMISLSECIGTFYFDDIKIIALNQDDYNKITEAETKKKQVNIITDSSAPEVLTFKNGNFENGLENWRGNAETSTEEKIDGQKSLKLFSQNPIWLGIDQIADIPEGSTSLDISASAKTKDLKTGKNDWNKGVMIVEFSKQDDTKTGEHQPIFFVADTHDWQKFSKLLSIPQDAKKYRIMIALSEATGTMYVDDIQIKFSK